MGQLICLLGIFSISFGAFAFEQSGALYRDFSEPRLDSSEACGSLCMQDYSYISRYQMENDFSQRGYYQAPITQFQNHVSKDLLVVKPNMSLSFKADSRLSRSVIESRIRWANMARKIGIGVSEHGRSLQSSVWRQVRRPLLHEVRRRVLKPYRGKKLSTEEKIEAWIIEQSVESSVGAFELDATSESVIDSESLDFGILDYSLKYRPKVDPLKGRYGLRLRYKKHLSTRRPFYANFSYYYCNSSWAVQKGRCGYQHELSGSVSTMTMRKRMRVSLFISYQAESLDESVYQNDGVAFDHKPWLGGVQLTYAFFR